ncbi:hypothetical protein CSPX01_11063 [Colletotrichum filicis]|nr:hypothetical protein CSPX01_11063 [Colletotrichum filicis]
MVCLSVNGSSYTEFLRSVEFNDADIKEPQTNAEEERQEMDFGLAKTNELVTFVGGSEGDEGEDEEPWINDWEAGQGKLRSWHNRTFANWIGCVSDDDGAVDMGQIDKPGVSW